MEPTQSILLRMYKVIIKNKTNKTSSWMLIVILVCFSITSCNLFSGNDNEWEDLGFTEQTVYKIFIDGDDVYAAAGHDGLWMRSKQNSGTWDYLGGSVEDGERHFESGVQAVDVYEGRITIGYTDPPEIEDGVRIGLWCSDNNGTEWQPCDYGVLEELGSESWSDIRTIQRSPHNTEHIIVGNGSVYKSINNGELYNRIYPEPNSSSFVRSLYFGLKWHPTDDAVIWAYGQTNRFQPWLMKTEDSGQSWSIFNQINVPPGNAFYSLTIDPVNPDIIYLGAQGAVIRSTKGGEEWMGEEPVPALFTDDRGNFFYALQTHPARGGVLFAAAAGRLYGSRNHGNAVIQIPTPENLTFILDMWFDPASNMLYAAGDGGVFRLHNPLNAIP